MELTLEDGKTLVRAARKAVERFFESRKVIIEKLEKFKEKRGAFVTIESFPGFELRGCIGYPYPILPLYEAVQRAAIEAAVNDPRFRPIEREDLDAVVFEVSVLSKPVEVKVKKSKEILDKIEQGKDGLIIEFMGHSGLFLPQVWKELPEKEDFLSNLCLKAGLLPDCWLQNGVRFYKFNVVAFKEVKPNGEVVKVNQT